MTYLEPSSSLTTIEETTALRDGTVDLVDVEGTTLQVSYLDGVGWALEVRLDLAIPGAMRQSFTGAQQHLSRAPLELSDSGNVVSLLVGGEMLRVEKAGGAFEIVRSGKVIFRSSEAPFRHHPTPTRLWEGLMSLKVTDFSTRAPQIPEGSQFETRMVRFSYPRPAGPVLGLPGQTGELNRNGYRFELYNTDEFVHTPGRKPMYQSWPILLHQDMSGEGWLAIFFDNPSRTFVDVGDFYPESVTFESIANNQRLYVIQGNSLGAVSNKLIRLLGEHALPPAWAFGYQQSRWSYMSSAEARRVMECFAQEKLPLDALYFDIDYMDGFRVFTQNHEHFKDMASLVDELHASGVHSVAIVDPGVKIDPEYRMYRTLSKSGAVLRGKDGKPFVAKVWPGECVLPDFGSARARELWSDAQAEWLRTVQLDGIWNDMNEPSNFDGQNAKTSDTSTDRGAFARESNLYGYWMAQASFEGWRKAHPQRRPFIISRSGYPGVQRHAVNWQGDNQTWWEHLRLAIDTTISYSLCGAFYTGADVPGFTGNPPEDLAVRFFQLGAWLPMFRGHSIFFAKDKEPYAFGGEARGLISAAIMQRYSLAREWYAGFARSCEQGIPPIVPVFTEQEGALVRDQMLLFGKFLVAPVIERDAVVRSFYLPPGRWYRLGNPAEVIPGNRWQMIPVSLADTPVFVREGSVVVRNQPERTMKETLTASERHEIYRDAQGAAKGYWYHDDLYSFPITSEQRKELAVSPGSPVVAERDLP